MKRILIRLCLGSLSFYSGILLAQPAAINPWPPLNTVTYQFVQEGWATSDTAEVTMAIDASVGQAKLDLIHQDIQAKLKQAAGNADWHITVFQRDKNNSGLEQIHAEASARLPIAGLGAIRANAKKLSSPGETFSVQNIDYSPSTAEIQKQHAELRDSMYAAVKAELARLNKVYPDQPYYLHEIDFGTALTAPMPRAMLATERSPQGLAQNDENSLPMSQQITEMATVILASKPAQLPQPLS